jgi:hypothetical protein
MHPIILISRKKDSNSTSDNICPTTNTSRPAIINFVSNLTYHYFSVILSGSYAALSALIVAVLIDTHAFCYSNPVQQRQIIRICLLVPLVALWSFLIVWQDDTGDYSVEPLDFGCAIALSAFLLFICDSVLSIPVASTPDLALVRSLVALGRGTVQYLQG